jgi:hypothetical protein
MKKILEGIRRLLSKCFLGLTMVMIFLVWVAFLISIVIIVLLVIAVIVDKCGFSEVAKVLAYPGRLFRYLRDDTIEGLIFLAMVFGFLFTLFRSKKNDRDW